MNNVQQDRLLTLLVSVCLLAAFALVVLSDTSQSHYVDVGLDVVILVLGFVLGMIWRGR